MRRTLFTKKVIKNLSPREKFLFEELKIDEPVEIDILKLSDENIESKIEAMQSDGVDFVQDEKNNIEAMIAQIKNEYEMKIAEAYQKGFKDAEKILREKINDELREHIAIFAQLLKNFCDEVESLGTKIENFVFSLAIKIAEKIVKREIEKNNDFVLNQVKEAVKRVVGVEKVKLRINPEDEKLIRELKPELLQMLDSTSEVIIETDPGIERGGCVVESELGNVDSRISTQFSLIENLLG
ncbi:MAG: FliH/SctL family protein [Candidatus Kryptonium sp.]